MNVPLKGIPDGRIMNMTECDYSVTIDGVEYHYRKMISKKKNAQNIVLLHGFASSTYSWEKIDHVLHDAGYSVWSLDMKGFGWSDKPRNAVYSPENLMEDVNRWMDRMGLEKVVFVGNSYGGGLGLLMAFSYPQKIDKLVMIDPGGLRMKLPLIFNIMRLPLTEYTSGLIFGRWMVWWLMRQVHHDKKRITREQIENYYSRLVSPGALRAQVALAKAIDFDRIEQYVERLSEVKQKTLIIWGENDVWIPLKLGYRLNRLIADSTLAIIERCGHIPQEEKPEVVIPLLLNFIRGRDISNSLRGFKERVFRLE
ncbi:MAG: alpha/beta hydrolase [Chrysiogenales bacterium]|nr:MAG: alpha/beta hydrolase [Chrysiogenales bacterium]